MSPFVTPRTTLRRGGLVTALAAMLAMMVGVGQLAAPAASADTLSYFFGTVTDATTHAPLVGAPATLYSSPDGAVVGSAVTGSDGSYTIPDVPNGSYTLQLAGPDGGGYVPVWSTNGQTVPSAAQVYVVSGAPHGSGIDAALQQGAMVSGTISGSGAGLAGVQVYFTQGSSYVEAITDSSGHYAAGLAAGSYTMDVRGPEGDHYIEQYWNGASSSLSATPVRVVTGVPQTLDMTLVAQGTVSGTLTGSDTGAGVADVSIVFFLSGGGSNPTAVTDGSGHYSISLAPGTYTVQAQPSSGSGYLSQWSNGVTSSADAAPYVVQAGQAQTLDLTVPRVASVSGTITGIDVPGVGVAGVTVQLGGPQVYSATTDASGDYTIPGIMPGDYSLTAFPPTGSGYDIVAWNGKSPAAGDTLTIGSGQTLTGIDVQLVHSFRSLGATIDGTAQVGRILTADPFGWSPVPDSYSYQWLRDGTAIPGATDQAYTVVAADFGLPLSVIVTGHLGAAYTDSLTSTITLPVAAAGTASISGTVKDAAGDPVDGVHVSACPDSDWTCLPEVVTGADGTYAITGLNVDGYSLTFDADGYVSTSPTVRVRSVGQAVTKNVTLAQAGSISGTVTDVSGNPVEGFQIVRIMNGDELYWIDTDASGHYTSGPIPVGDYTVSFFADGYVRESWNDVPGIDGGDAVTVTAGQDASGIDAVLTQAASVSGVVRSPQGDPVGGQFYGYTDSSGAEYLFGPTDSDGAYSITGLAPGTYSLFFDAPAPYLTTTVPVTLAAGDNTRDVTLDAGATVSGTVTGPDGPLADADVGLLQKVTGGYSRNDVTTDADGQYSFDAVVPGTYTLTAGGVDGLVDTWWNGAPDISQAAPITVTAGEQRTGLDLTLGSAVTIWGTVTGSDAKTVGLPGALVNVIAGGAVVGSGTTDAQGHYAIGGLTTGSYTLQVVPPAGSHYLGQWWASSATQAGATTIHVTAGTALPTSNMQLPVAAQVSGTITGVDDGAAVPGATVALYSFGSRSVVATTTTNGAGAYAFGSLAAGSYGVDVTPPTGSTYGEQWFADARSSSTATRIALTAGQTLTGQDLTLTRWLTTSTPTVSGVAAVGSTLTASAGVWGPGTVQLSYQWYRNSAPIAGATGATYVAIAADQGTKLSVQVTGTEQGYETATVASASTASVAQNLTTVTPTITGTPQLGQVLTAVPGAWGPGTVSFTYQWLRNGTPISGRTGTAKTYTVVSADIGTALSVSVTGKKAQYATVTLTSDPTVLVAPGTLVPTALPAVTGTTSVGQTLSATPGSWTPGGAAFTYQWTRDGHPIDGAAGATYTLVNDDAAAVIAVVVTAAKTDYADAAATSPSTATITGGVLSTTVPTISGIAKVGVSLTASAGRWGPGTVDLAYQWLSDGNPIAGATDESYTPTPADEGASLTVAVTGTRTDFTTATETSAATTPIEAAPEQTLSTTSLSIGGSVTVGGIGYEPGEPVEVWLHSTPALLGAGTADSTGRVSITVTIPTVATGTHQIETRGSISGSAFTTVTIGAATGDPSGVLAFTGSDAGGAGLVALLALLLGVAIVARPRRGRVTR